MGGEHPSTSSQERPSAVVLQDPDLCRQSADIRLRVSGASSTSVSRVQTERGGRVVGKEGLLREPSGMPLGEECWGLGSQPRVAVQNRSFVSPATECSLGDGVSLHSERKRGTPPRGHSSPFRTAAASEYSTGSAPPDPSPGHPPTLPGLPFPGKLLSRAHGRGEGRGAAGRQQVDGRERQTKGIDMLIKWPVRGEGVGRG